MPWVWTVDLSHVKQLVNNPLYALAFLITRYLAYIKYEDFDWKLYKKVAHAYMLDLLIKVFTSK
jgi:hypothetical protein